MPTDARQIEDDAEQLRRQNKTLQALLDEALHQNRQAREMLAKAEQSIAELRAILSVVCEDATNLRRQLQEINGVG